LAFIWSIIRASWLPTRPGIDIHRFLDATDNPFEPESAIVGNDTRPAAFRFLGNHVQTAGDFGDHRLRLGRIVDPFGIERTGDCGLFDNRVVVA
jgi:hypothetical protein